MGQYQRWLHHREVDQHLHSQLTSLEQDLLHVQSQLDSAEYAATLPANPLMLALSKYLAEAQPALKETQPRLASVDPLPAAGSVSPALSAWGHLPNFDAHELPAATLDTAPAHAQARPDENLLPIDMDTFVDDHSQTAPQVQLPWWMHAASTDQPDQALAPDARTNQRVQRWFERRKHLSQDAGNGQEEPA